MRKLLPIALSLLLAGCPRAGLPPAGLSTAPTSSNQGFLVPSPEAMGTLSIAIRWPDRAVASIPLSANSASLSIYDASGTLIASSSVARPSSGTLSSQVFFRMKATLGARVVARLFREAVPLPTSSPIALGTGNVDIYANNVNVVAITMQPLVQPTIAVLSPNYGGLGRQVVISGGNFGWAAGLPCSVWFSGVSASFRRISDQEIDAVVPAGAVSGKLAIAVDGVRTDADFRVLTALSLPVLNLPLQAYRSLPLAVSGTFSDASTASVTALSYSSSNPAVASVDTNGLLRPISPGTASIAVASGLVSAQANVTVTTVGAVIVSTLTVPVSAEGSLGVPVALPSAAAGNQPVTSTP